MECHDEWLMDYEHHLTYENGWSWLMGHENEASNNTWN
jgi:hypothetical protein